MSRTLVTVGLLAGLLAPSAWAAEDVGIPVTVVVADPEGAPIPTAVVRHPKEKERHPVNSTTGEWTESVLYLADGAELAFLKGMVLELEISAPSFVNQRITYVIRKRNNKFTVNLQRMDLAPSDANAEDPVIQFGRDHPLDGKQPVPQDPPPPKGQ